MTREMITVPFLSVDRMSCLPFVITCNARSELLEQGDDMDDLLKVLDGIKDKPLLDSNHGGLGLQLEGTQRFVAQTARESQFDQ